MGSSGPCAFSEAMALCDVAGLVEGGARSCARSEQQIYSSLHARFSYRSMMSRTHLAETYSV